MKKSLRKAEVVLTKECNRVKDLEQELKDLKSHITMEVDEGVPYWLTEEEGFKPSNDQPTVSRDSSAEDWALQSTSLPSTVWKSSKEITWHYHQVIHLPTLPFVERGRGW